MTDKEIIYDKARKEKYKWLITTKQQHILQAKDIYINPDRMIVLDHTYFIPLENIDYYEPIKSVEKVSK